MREQNEIHYHRCPTCGSTLGCHQTDCLDKSGVLPRGINPLREALVGAESQRQQYGWRCWVCRFGTGTLQADPDSGKDRPLAELVGAELIDYILRHRRTHFRYSRDVCGGQVCQRCGEIGYWFAPTSPHPLHGPDGFICNGCWSQKPEEARIRCQYCEFCRDQIWDDHYYVEGVWACDSCIDGFRLSGCFHEVKEITHELLVRRYWQEYDRQLALPPILTPSDSVDGKKRGEIIRIGPNQLSLLKTLSRAPEGHFRSLSAWFNSTPEAYRVSRETLRQSCWGVVSHRWASASRTGRGFECTITNQGRRIADDQVPFMVLRRSHDKP